MTIRPLHPRESRYDDALLLRRRLYSHPLTLATPSQPPSVGCKRLDVATSRFILPTMKCPHLCDAVAPRRWAIHGQKDENELVFPHQPPQQQSASLSRTGPKPKTHRAAAVAGFPSPSVVVPSSPSSTSTRSKKQERRKKTSSTTRKGHNDDISSKNAAERATFRLERRKAAT